MADTRTDRRDFTTPDTRLPAHGQRVEWIDSSGHISRGVYRNGLWWIGDMYIYYVPTFWRPADES